MSTLENVNSKLGQIFKCPNCGAQVNRLQVKCPECGFIFSNVEANATSASLLEKLEQIDMDCMNNVALSVSRKVQVIQNYPIPNTREDLLEMMTLCHANITKASDKALANAWSVKTIQLVSKAEILLKGDKDAESMIAKIKDTESNKKRKKILLFSVIGVLVVVAIAVSLLGWNSHSQVEAEHNQVVAEWQHRISDAVQEAEYAYAYDYLDSLNFYIESQEINRKIYKDLAGSSYLKLVMALLREDAIEDAAVVALDYRDKLNDQELWHESQIYKLMKQTCEAQNIDDSVLE